MSVSDCLLVPMAETNWKFEPMLVGKSSFGPDRVYILSDQVFHRHRYCSVMDSQELSACFEGFRKIHLVFIFCFAVTDIHLGNNGRAKVVKNIGGCLYFKVIETDTIITEESFD